MINHSEKPVKWGRFHVHAAKAKTRPIDENYAEDYGVPMRREADPVFEEDAQERCTKHSTCVKTAYQKAVISIPVAVKPFSMAGPTSTLCCSEPVVTNVRCTGAKEKVCYFTITQEICVEVPIHIGAEAHVGDPGVDCLETSLVECDDCVESDD